MTSPLLLVMLWQRLKLPPWEGEEAGGGRGGSQEAAKSLIRSGHRARSTRHRERREVLRDPGVGVGGLSKAGPTATSQQSAHPAACVSDRPGWCAASPRDAQLSAGPTAFSSPVDGRTWRCQRGGATSLSTALRTWAQSHRDLTSPLLNAPAQAEGRAELTIQVAATASFLTSVR